MERFEKESKSRFKFRNVSMGEILETTRAWWNEVKGPTHKNVDEVPMKFFLRFALKRRIIVDEKEIEAFFKDLAGDEKLADSSFIK